MPVSSAPTPGERSTESAQGTIQRVFAEAPFPSYYACPRVSIVILNYNGRHHLQGCFESLAALDYPKDRPR